MTRTVVRKRFNGVMYRITFDDADPDWRSKKLAKLHDQSDEAWVVRSLPLTAAERAASEARFRDWERAL